MPGHDIIVVGASAGGVEALAHLVSGLPGGLPAAVFVVLHVPTNGMSVLPAILSRYARVPAAHAADEQAIQPGRIYVAPPNCHLLVRDGRIRLGRGPREHGHRPSVDALFRSAASTFGLRVVGVVLSGALGDGTAGLLAIKERGGVAVVQDPVTARFSGMPRSALDNVPVDHCVPLHQIAPLLVALVHRPVTPDHAPPVPQIGALGVPPDTRPREVTPDHAPPVPQIGQTAPEALP